MKDDIIFFLICVLGIYIYLFFVYRVLLDVMKKVKRDKEIDNEEVPDDIHATEI